jgi:hypothetical protein
MSEQHNNLVRQKSWSVEIPLTAPTKTTNIRALSMLTSLNPHNVSEGVTTNSGLPWISNPRRDKFHVLTIENPTLM